VNDEEALELLRARLTPIDALTDLSVGECSALDHVDAIVARMLERSH
jgi:hypothetical protein